MFSTRTSWPRDKNPLSEAEGAARAFGAELLDLTASNPTATSIAYDKDAILRALADERALKYEPAPFGPMAAREAVAQYYARRRIDVSPEDIAIVTSTSEGYSFLFKLLANAGESIAVPRPSYPLFNFLADLADVTLAPYHLRYGAQEGWRLDLSSVAEALDETTRAIITVGPNNPTGSCLNSAELTELLAIAASKEQAIISDEVFLDYLYDRSAVPKTTLITKNDALGFTLSGLSKVAGLPQMKAGWIVLSGPKALKDEARERLEIIGDAHLSVSTPIARALPELLETAEVFQKKLSERIAENRKVLAESGLNVRRADGGWYAMIDLPPEKDDEAWAIALLEEDRVLVHPGYLFDVEEPSTVVVSVIADPPIFETAIARIAKRT